jgi:hypothetical protein
LRRIRQARRAARHFPPRFAGGLPDWRRSSASAVRRNTPMHMPRTDEHSQASPASRWDVLVNWLALLMLLAAGVVWPPG